MILETPFFALIAKFDDYLLPWVYLYDSGSETVAYHPAACAVENQKQ
ncbi:hypothetical protein [Pseudoteredinibacter isoporae]